MGEGEGFASLLKTDFLSQAINLLAPALFRSVVAIPFLVGASAVFCSG
jgi:hypothetical protein